MRDYINTCMANPVLTTPSGSIGTHRSDNRFAFRFLATDPDSDAIEFVLYDSAENPVAEVVPGLTLNSSTGWYHGAIPAIALDTVYNFKIAVRKVTDPGSSSEKISFSLDVKSSTNTAIINWVTDSDLGTIENGAVSTLRVQAESSQLDQLIYELYTPADAAIYQRLPQGLQLALDGSIRGRVAFIDSDYDGSSLSDQTFEFRVQARNSGNTVMSIKTFNLTVKNTHARPFENLYFVSLVSDDFKLRLENVESAVSFDAIYRPDDPEFGAQKKLRILLAQGLSPSTETAIVSAMTQNFYKKLLRFSEPRLARALDRNNQVIYEVIYLRVLDDLENDQGISVPESAPISTGAVSLNSVYQDLVRDSEIEPAADVIYPNSIQNMRNVLISALGQDDATQLPAWMTSRQASGEIFNWIPAAVLCYVKPGFGQAALTSITRSGFSHQNTSFWLDRLVWDQNLSYVWDKNQQAYLDREFTSFDSGTTIFDGSGTRFQSFVQLEFPFARISPRSYEAPEKNDKYLVFPRHGVLK